MKNYISWISFSTYADGHKHFSSPKIKKKKTIFKLHSCLWKLKIKIRKMISYILQICFSNFKIPKKKKQFYYSWKIWREIFSNFFYLCTTKRGKIHPPHMYFIIFWYFILFFIFQLTRHSFTRKVRLNIKTAYIYEKFSFSQA